ncbi:MAG: pyridoxamine 5'-phosphate oxidase family protein, partial [Caldilineaceae bacterium]|nr:pyridoxamine 5'-phosphate oxidase family protein [Caldilineaceae bacterium]
MSLYLSGLRKEYRRERLDEATAAADPLSMFEEWFAEAAESGLVEPNAMTLATATPEGKPSARVVLLKDFDATGFSFFTNYASRKGQEI